MKSIWLRIFITIYFNRPMNGVGLNTLEDQRKIMARLLKWLQACFVMGTEYYTYTNDNQLTYRL